MTNSIIIDNPFTNANNRINALCQQIKEKGYQQKKIALSEIDLHLHSNYSDGYYVLIAKAIDTSGHEDWSELVPFSIRN